MEISSFIIGIITGFALTRNLTNKQVSANIQQTKKLLKRKHEIKVFKEQHLQLDKQRIADIKAQDQQLPHSLYKY